MTAQELAFDIERRVRRNLGVFEVPKFNCVGDPFDKPNHRPLISKRVGLAQASVSEYWKQAIQHESRVYGGVAAAPAPAAAADDNMTTTSAITAAAAAAPAAPSPQPLVINPPGWYWLPTNGAWVQAYMAQPFASPPPPPAA